MVGCPVHCRLSMVGCQPRIFGECRPKGIHFSTTIPTTEESNTEIMAVRESVNGHDLATSTHLARTYFQRSGCVCLIALPRNWISLFRENWPVGSANDFNPQSTYAGNRLD